MSVGIGIFEDDSGKQFAMFVDPERELYYDRVFANVRGFHEGRTVTLHCAEPPSAPPLGDPIMSLTEFARLVAGSGMPAPSSIAPLLTACAGSGMASTILPPATRSTRQTPALGLPMAGAGHSGGGLGTVAQKPQSMRARLPEFPHISSPLNRASISLMGPVATVPKRPDPTPSDMSGS